MKAAVKFLVLISLIHLFLYSNQNDIFKEINGGNSVIVDYSIDNYFMTTTSYFWKVKLNDKELVPVYSWKNLTSSFNNDKLEEFYKLFPYDGKRVVILSNGDIYIFTTQKEKQKGKVGSFPYLKKSIGNQKNYETIREKYEKFKLDKKKLDFIKKMISDSEMELSEAYIPEIYDDWDYDKPKDTYYYNNYMKLLRLNKYEYIEMEEKDEKEYYTKISEQVFKTHNIEYGNLDFSKTKLLMNYLDKLFRE